MGRGIFTTEPIRARTIVEVSPVIVLSANDRRLVDQTLLHDYIFEWGEVPGQCCMALGYVPLYNHSYRSNCDYEMEYEHALIRVRALRKIEKGEELFINYNGAANSDARLWFEAAEGTNRHR